jgi:hypothetical protein
VIALVQVKCVIAFPHWYSTQPLEEVLSITTPSKAHCEKYKSQNGPQGEGRATRLLSAGDAP